MVAIAAGGLLFAVRQAPLVVTIPALSPAAQAGQEVFGRLCVRCHGARAQGTPTGPPLIHSTYRPGHHPDAMFERAIGQGVRAHHWNRGDMPAQPAVTPTEIGEITRYIREVQEANGIR
jgi:mono/diheme cytochrome c family protein